MQQTDVDAAQVKDVVQGRYHHPPYCNYQSNHGVDEEQQVRQQEETLSADKMRFLDFCPCLCVVLKTHKPQMDSTDRLFRSLVPASFLMKANLATTC